MESVRELIKEEIKKRIRAALDDDPELKAELKKAVEELVEARMREAYAILKLGKCGAEIGLKIVPKDLKERMENEIASLLEKEVFKVVEKID